MPSIIIIFVPLFVPFLLCLQYVPIDEAHPLKAVSPYGACTGGERGRGDPRPAHRAARHNVRRALAGTPANDQTLPPAKPPPQATPSSSLRTSSGTCPPPTPSGASSCCATSTPWARTPAVSLPWCCRRCRRDRHGRARDFCRCCCRCCCMQSTTNSVCACPLPLLSCRQDWGAPGHAEQPDAVGAGGGAGPSPRAGRVW